MAVGTKDFPCSTNRSVEPNPDRSAWRGRFYIIIDRWAAGHRMKRLRRKPVRHVGKANRGTFFILQLSRSVVVFRIMEGSSVLHPRITSTYCSPTTWRRGFSKWFPYHHVIPRIRKNTAANEGNVPLVSQVANEMAHFFVISFQVNGHPCYYEWIKRHTFTIAIEATTIFPSAPTIWIGLIWLERGSSRRKGWLIYDSFSDLSFVWSRYNLDFF